MPSDAAGVFQLTVAPVALYSETIPTGGSCAGSGAALGCSVGAALSEAAGVGVTVVESEEDEFLDTTKIPKIKIPTATATTMPFEEPELLLAGRDV